MDFLMTVQMNCECKLTKEKNEDSVSKKKFLQMDLVLFFLLAMMRMVTLLGT